MEEDKGYFGRVCLHRFSECHLTSGNKVATFFLVQEIGRQRSFLVSAAS